jgi:hypothetical protein
MSLDFSSGFSAAVHVVVTAALTVIIFCLQAAMGTKSEPVPAPVRAVCNRISPLSPFLSVCRLRETDHRCPCQYYLFAPILY